MEAGKRDIKVRFCENFRNRWLQVVAKNEGISLVLAKDFYDGPQLEELSERVSGKEGAVVENRYENAEIDYFEKVDDDFVIPKSLFTILG